jgi:ATP-dependent DNA helicase RecG
MKNLTSREVARLLQQEEGQYLELKSLWDLGSTPRRALPRPTVRKVIAEYVAAFANADGGTLILGAEDDGTPTGHSYTDEAVEGFVATLERRLRPVVRVIFQRLTVKSRELLIFSVPIHPVAVMVEGDGFPYRVGDQVLHEPQEVINTRKAEYRRLGYERQTRPEAGLDALDLDLARQVLAQTPYRDRSIDEALMSYGLTIPREGGPAVTNAALLLFGRRPFARWHPRAGARVFKVDGSSRAHGRRRNVTQVHRIEPPLGLAIQELHRTVASQIRRSEKLHSLFFRELPEYPEFAWQEAVVNAFAHRDYRDQGREVEVWLFDDRMEVLSPGDLVPPVTLDALRERRRVHASRNPLIVRVLADVGIMREEGEGIPRIHEEMESWFLEPPRFDLADDTFCLTLFNTPIFETPSASWQGTVDTLALSTNQKRVLLAHPTGFTNEDYRYLTDLDRDQAYREIQELVAAGVVQPPAASGRGAVYRISPDLRNSVKWLERRIPKIRKALEAKGRLTNTAYRELFNVTRYTAVRELKRLVEEGFLELIGEKRGAHYLSGPKLRL